MKRLLKRLLLRLLYMEYGRRLPHPTQEEQARITRLRDELRQLPQEAASAPSAAHWQKTADQLRHLVLHKDPRYFLRWDLIQTHMFVAYRGYVRDELRYLESLPDWRERWNPAIEETGTGGPLRYPFCTRSSANLIHQTYHVARFEKSTGMKASEFDCVFEFGAGYGNMCRVFRRLGFRGRYILFDLPHFSALQRFYLSAEGLEAGASFLSSIDAMPRELPTEGRRLFLSTWAISETPLELRMRVLPLVRDFAKLIAYQDRFHEMDNESFFGTWRGAHQEPITHLPGNRYLFSS